MKIIDSWAELKAKAEITSYALPSNYKEALQALLEKETENERKALANSGAKTANWPYKPPKWLM